MWHLMVRAAQEKLEVEMSVAGELDPMIGRPTLPVAAQHVVLENGTVVALSAVRHARIRDAGAEDDDREPF